MKADQLNTNRQYFIHATFAATEEGKYVRFSKLVGYADLAKDIKQLIEVTKEVNALVEELDQKTGSLLTDLKQSKQVMISATATTFRSHITNQE